MDAILSGSRLTLFSMGGRDRAKIPDGIRATGVRDYLERQGHSREAQHRPGELGASPGPKGRLRMSQDSSPGYTCGLCVLAWTRQLLSNPRTGVLGHSQPSLRDLLWALKGKRM
jgi:hypothetical protein